MLYQFPLLLYQILLYQIPIWLYQIRYIRFRYIKVRYIKIPIPLAPLRVVNELYNLMSHYSGFRGRLRVTHIRDCKLDPNQTLDLIKC